MVFFPITLLGGARSTFGSLAPRSESVTRERFSEVRPPAACRRQHNAVLLDKCDRIETHLVSRCERGRNNVQAQLPFVS